VDVERLIGEDHPGRAMGELVGKLDGGFAPRYNAQVSTEAAEGIIVGLGVSPSGSDYGQLIAAVEKVERKLGRGPEQGVVDGGFTSRQTILALDHRGVDLIGWLDDGGGSIGRSDGAAGRRFGLSSPGLYVTPGSKPRGACGNFGCESCSN